MKLYERIENNNFDEIDRNRAIELIEGGNGHLVYNENYFKLQKENEEKNKIIDSMIKVMIENSICDYFIKEKCKNYAGENGKTCDECIKQYFENKVKEVK